MNSRTVISCAFVGMAGMAGAMMAGPLGAGIGAGLASAVYAGMRSANRRIREVSHVDQIDDEDPEEIHVIADEPSVEHDTE